MAQILVITDTSEVDGEVVYRESVGAVHLEGHAGAQLVERLRWAVRDAAVAEHRAMLKAVEPVGEERRPLAPDPPVSSHFPADTAGFCELISCGRFSRHV